MAVAVLHCKSDSVNCGTVYRAGDPHPCPRRRWHTTATASPTSLDHPAGGPRQTRWQSPSEGKLGNRSQASLPRTTAK